MYRLVLILLVSPAFHLSPRLIPAVRSVAVQTLSFAFLLFMCCCRHPCMFMVSVSESRTLRKGSSLGLSCRQSYPRGSPAARGAHDEGQDSRLASRSSRTRCAACNEVSCRAAAATLSRVILRRRRIVVSSESFSSSNNAPSAQSACMASPPAEPFSSVDSTCS